MSGGIYHRYVKNSAQRQSRLNVRVSLLTMGLLNRISCNKFISGEHWKTLTNKNSKMLEKEILFVKYRLCICISVSIQPVVQNFTPLPNKTLCTMFSTIRMSYFFGIQMHIIISIIVEMNYRQESIIIHFSQGLYRSLNLKLNTTAVASLPSN